MDDDLQDPCWSWPHWKFGLKRSDLFTKLHDQYNTVPSAIQDPEAFHHDVYEISNEATSADDFHRLLQDRKEQRLRELNNSLESAAFEIIANPSLIGTEQWQHAVQLFRTKSLDSLVRYFASYLPKDHPWHRPAESSSVSETSSTVDSLTNSHGSFFGDHYDEPIMMDEPLELTATFEGLLPPSPRSMTMCSDSSAACRIDMAHHKYDLNTLTPPRTLSYTDSEPDLHDDDASQPCDPASPATPVSDVASYDAVDAVVTTTCTSAHVADSTCLFSMVEMVESNTPTPKPERPSSSFFETKPSLPHRRHRRGPSASMRCFGVLEVWWTDLPIPSVHMSSYRTYPCFLLMQP
ncbi:hypothetical protein B0H67DRAFT_90411 [Lasiosphaeris hirsuta]|uniref:Uncharacterized protein n=1 Tax=Lasiosphaeris hirsuta TaxID=260670 RepID=A0AA40EC35_9PEZI|nr:hypothetical protein B0H67DRAFT_90411 [Lasiosphaeris hirsuta]